MKRCEIVNETEKKNSVATLLVPETCWENFADFLRAHVAAIAEMRRMELEILMGKKVDPLGGRAEVAHQGFLNPCGTEPHEGEHWYPGCHT